MRILVGIPSVDNKINVNVVHSFLDQLPFIVENHHRVQCKTVTHTLIHNARNGIAKDAVDYDYLFFLDSDCVIPPNTLKRLVEHDKDIVSGLYFQRREPFLPVLYNKREDGTYRSIIDYDKGLLEVEGVGMGVCLIKRRVLEKLGENPFDPIPVSVKKPRHSWRRPCVLR